MIEAYEGSVEPLSQASVYLKAEKLIAKLLLGA